MLLQASDIRRGRVLQGAGVDVAEGEVVGLAGLLGSGRTELAKAIFGAEPVEAGNVSFLGRNRPFRAPREAIQAGMGFCSEDRKAEGIIPFMSVRENITLAALPQLSRLGVVSRKRQDEIVDRFIQRLGIKTPSPDQVVRNLSGGNQQKVILARWLCMNPKLLILDEPTRGIDVGAKAEIQNLIGELAGEGLGILMISSELEELEAACDRAVVLCDGRNVADLDSDHLTPDQIMGAIAGARSERRGQAE